MNAVRTLRAGDFFPDLVARDANGRSMHSAELGGYAHVFWLFPNSASQQQFAAQVQVLAAALPELPHASLCFHTSPETLHAMRNMLSFALTQPPASTLFFTADASGPLCCMVAANSQILALHTLPDAQNHTAWLAEIRARQQRTHAKPEHAAPPILLIENALPLERCRALIQRFVASQEKVQGRVGLSAPQLDPSRKRVSHINLEPEAGAALDMDLVFSLLPMLERCYEVQISRRVAYKVSMYDALDHGFFHPHRDNSDPATQYRKLALSLSLNDDWDGGGLCFPEFGPRTYRIGAGNALIFPVSLMHQVIPVTQGQRFMLLSFLYDEAGAALRRSTMDKPEMIDQRYPDHFAPAALAAYRTRFATTPRYAPQYAQNDSVPMLMQDFLARTATKASAS
jgi:predicted 2-oxoglutarate/Fe(II)-dependent dioxygenase YbiX